MPPILPSNPDVYIHTGEGVYTSLGEKFDIPPETLGSLGEQAIKAKDLAYCRSLLSPPLHCPPKFSF